MSAPVIVHEGPLLDDSLRRVLDEYRSPDIIDIYDQQREELKEIKFQGEPREMWLYFSWKKTLLRTIDADSLFALRTNRNKLLVTEDEQRRLHEAVVGVAGMSVGSGIAIGAVYSGIANTIKIADRDTLDTSNLNRLRESLLSIGKPKVALAAQHIYEINPYADVREFENGITDDVIDGFFADPKLSVVVDEIDDFKMKVQLRAKAKEHSVPLLMFTSLGDNILVDVERYDIEPDRELFHGLFGDAVTDIVHSDAITPEDVRRYSVALADPQYIPTRALQSVAEMGKSLAGRPQLYSTIAVDGGFAAYIIRQLILGKGPASGRYFVKFGELFGISDGDFDISQERQEILAQLRTS